MNGEDSVNGIVKDYSCGLELFKCLHGKCLKHQYVTVIKLQKNPLLGMPTTLCPSLVFHKEGHKWKTVAMTSAP